MMSDFAIISDTACDMTKDLRERFGLDDVLKGYLIFPDGHEEHGDLDWNNYSPEEYYDIVADKNTFIKTAQPAPAHITEVFEKQLAQGRDVLAVLLSTGISGVYGSSCICAEKLMEKYPGRKIICVDSKRYSTCLSLLCIYACQMRAAGKSLEETAQWLEENKNCVHQIGTVEDLFFCRRMGRVSGTAAFMGTLVGVKPLADFDDKGLSHVIGKVRGRQTMYRAIVDYMKQTIVHPEDQIIFVAHSARPNQAQELYDMVVAEIKPKECIINNVGQQCGTSIGPGLIAAFYYGKPISDGLVEEQKILADVTGK